MIVETLVAGGVLYGAYRYGHARGSKAAQPNEVEKAADNAAVAVQASIDAAVKDIKKK